MLVRKVLSQSLDVNSTKAKDVMQQDVKSIEPNEDVYAAIMKMRDYNIKQLPVVDSGKLVGLLTMKDVLKIEPQLFELLVEKINVREGDKTPVSLKPVAEGVCELCGEYTQKVTETDSVYMCDACNSQES